MKSSSPKNGKLTIGRLAEAAGVGIATVRYYQRRKLLPLPQKPQFGGFRAYGEEDLDRLLQIRRAQELGFTLAEIQDLLDYLQSHNCDSIKLLAGDKLAAINKQIRDLEAIRKNLSQLVETCTGDCPRNCPLVNKLCAKAPG